MNTTPTSRKPDFEHISNIFERTLESIGKRTETPYFPFGFKKLDKLTHGFPLGKVTVIGARTSEGKTSFAIQQAMRFAIRGTPVTYISLEDSKESLAEKIFCNYFCVDNSKLKEGVVDGEKVQKAKEAIQHLTIAVLNDYGYNFEEFQDLVLNQPVKPEIIFLDYVNLIEYRTDEQRETIGKFMNQVKRLSLNRHLAVVVLAQVNRAGAEGGNPSLHHLKACGSLEEVADLVLLLHHPFRHNWLDYFDNEIPKDQVQSYFEIEVAKNKTGPCGICPLSFEGQFSRFGEPLYLPGYSDEKNRLKDF